MVDRPMSGSGGGSSRGGDPLDLLKDGPFAEPLPGASGDSGNDASARAEQKADEVAGQAQQKAGEAVSKAQEKADQGVSSAASGLGKAAETLRSQGEQRGGSIGSAASTAATQLDQASSYLQNKDSDQLMSDLESLVRRKPVESLLVAAGVGFVLSKLFS